jgi:hypothetical protein
MYQCNVLRHAAVKNAGKPVWSCWHLVWAHTDYILRIRIYVGIYISVLFCSFGCKLEAHLQIHQFFFQSFQMWLSAMYFRRCLSYARPTLDRLTHYAPTTLPPFTGHLARYLTNTLTRSTFAHLFGHHKCLSHEFWRTRSREGYY